jgi:tetratricopeptide (TPR) repeat protein
MGRSLLAIPFLFLCFLLQSAALFLPSCASAADPVPLNENVEELLRKKEYEKALKQLQREYDLFPLNLTLKQNLAVVYGLVGRRQLERKQYDEAAASFDHARELEPDNPEYRLGRGIALYGGKHYDDALFELEQARLFGGDTVDVFFFLGKVYYDTGNLDAALDAWQKGLALDPGNEKLRSLVEKAGREASVEGRMKKETGSRFTITYDVATETRFADDIRDALETAYNRVGSDLDCYPEARIPVLLYTRKDFREVTAGPEWSGGIFDGKIRLPIGGLREITPQVRAVLHHEYTHVVVRELTKGNCPTWLNEGLAQFEEYKEFAFPLTDLQKAVQQGRLLSAATLEGSFLSLSAQQAVVAYRQSYAMVSYLISVYGWYKVKEILVNLGMGMTTPDAIGKAFKDYGVSYANLQQEWQEYLKREYGGN